MFFELATGEKMEYREIEAYSRLQCIDIEPWEVNAIMEMDKEHKAFITEKLKAAQNA